MIHKIHRGENLPSLSEGRPYVIYGFGGSAHDFGGVRFPGILKNCATCHVEDTFNLAPTAAVCTSCHDGSDALAHAQIMTSDSGVESCTACHDFDKQFSAARLHRK